MKSIYKEIRTNLIYVFAPLIGYLVARLMGLEVGFATTYFVFMVIFLVISIIGLIGHSAEILYKVPNGETKFVNVIFPIILIVLIISLTFTSYYYCLYDYDRNAFWNLREDNFGYTVLQLFLYSIGTFTMTNTTQVVANSPATEIVSTIQSLSSFVLLVLIIGNFRDLKG